MKISVIYRSLTGHSKKIARAVAAELGAEALDIKKKPVIEGADVLFIAGGIYGGKSMAETIGYIQTLDPARVKRAVLLTSSASDKTGQDNVREALKTRGIPVEPEEYRCIGGFLFYKMGRPNKKEIAAAVEFAKKFV